MNMSEFDGSRGTGQKVTLSAIGIVARLLIAFVLIFFLIYIGRVAYSLGYEAFSQNAVSSAEEGHDVTVTVTEDMSTSDIWEMLRKAGLIKESENAFRLQDMMFGLDGKIRPGEYTLNTSMTVNEMYQIMSAEPEEEEEE